MTGPVDASWVVECRDCRYWVPGTSNKGYCRRRAPVPLPWTPSMGFAFSVSRKPCWPVTDQGDFCGEGVRKGTAG